MAATTLDPGYKSTGMALSGSNLVGTSSAQAGAGSTRTITGKSYFEAVITTLAGTPSVGLANQSNANYFNSTLLGADTHSLAYRSSGAVVVNAATLATIATFVQGDRIDCAVDVGSRLIWFRVNGGNWNNNAANNPATGVGGIDFSTMNIATCRAAIGASITGTVWTTKFTAPFTGAAPSGFSSLDTMQITVGQSTDQQRSVRSFSPAGTMTTVSGTTKESGVAVSGKKVYMYDRSTGDLIGCATSDGSGNWSINAVGRPAVLIVGSDPAFNSVVYDNVVPL
jgi:hypothetical protein